MSENAIERTGAVKAEPGNWTQEEVEVAGMFVDLNKKRMEIAGNLAGKALDYADKERDRNMRMAIYADKSMKWEKNFEEIKANNERMYDLLSRAFKDRRDTIDKQFEIIDQGLKDNNMQMVLGAAGYLANIVSNSPLAEVAANANKLFKAGRISELDPI